MTTTRAEFRLPPSAESPGVARRHVRQQLAAAGRDEWSDAAELAVSEVVTNGVLHAHSGLVLRLEVRPHEALVEVEDGSPMMPTQRTGRPEAADDTSTTGRGLALLAAVTRSRGVRAVPSGKVVWFTVGDDGESDEDALLAALDDDWDVEELDRGDDGRAVTLLGLPSTLWMAAREHHQTLLRELVLFLAEHGDDLPSPPDLPAADAARSLLWSALVDELDRGAAQGRDRSASSGGSSGPRADAPGAVDLVLHVPEQLGSAFGAMQDALDVAEDLAVHDRLLVRPGLPEIIAVRDWACEQVVAQLAGVAASPWPGTDQERFTELTHDRVTAEVPRWDSTLVTGSDRGVVAADDANRILAVSTSLAALTGWDPEELVGRRVVALIPGALREAHVAGFSRHLSTGQARILGVPLELPVLHRDGTELTCSLLVERAETFGRAVYLAWIEALDS